MASFRTERPYYMPYSHSLIAAVLWSAAGYGLYRLWRRPAGGAATLVGLAVFSHWILDFVVHRPDLPLYDDTAQDRSGLVEPASSRFRP
jgi:membrane-bound metal-dependent hydrolase YbcI (DUF457 family)